MRISTLAVLAATTSAACAYSIRRSGTPQQVVYWGQNDAEKSLGTYCAANQGIDVVVLSFLSTYGKGRTPSGSFGDSCNVDSKGVGSGCESLAKDITACHAAGKKVLLSIGGGGASGSLASQGDAEGVAYTLWNSYANPAKSAAGSSRPFGNVAIDGWDLDIESNPGGTNTNYQYMINKLRNYMATDNSTTYYISGAPQCPLPEENMGDAINNSKFDWLFVQFYNNPECSAYQVPRSDGGKFNFDKWQTYVAGTKSAGAKLFIGLPASDTASGDTPAEGKQFYITPTELTSMVNTYKTHAGFGGVMLWDAGSSDQVNTDGCTYAEHVSSIFKTGKSC